MSKRAQRNNSDAASHFPFLAVLLCTMGALLVLLVVLAQRVAEQSAVDLLADSKQVEEVAEPASDTAHNPDDLAEIAELKERLQEKIELQKKFDAMREKAEQQLKKEQDRLSHIEEHTRRIEHELARLSIAADQLKATENNQSIDQEVAQTELDRLESLIKENEKNLDELRKQHTGKQSYAIVPYQGPNGTFRKPIYIECRKDSVVIQPEGVEFSAADFAAASWAGNPLASAIRASREYLNNKAAKAGAPEPPDPYPLLLVSPDGISTYAVARVAITSSNSDYGYEFISGDGPIEYPEMADPLLAQAQSHAAMNARDRMVQLARLAPSRFRKVNTSGLGGSGQGGSVGTSETASYGSEAQFGSNGNGDGLSQSFEDVSSNDQLATGDSASHYGTRGNAGASETGSSTDSLLGSNSAGQTGDSAGGQGSESAGEFGATTNVNGNSGQLAQGGNPSQSSSGASASGSSATGSSTSTTNSAHAMAAGSKASGGQPPASMSIANQATSIAEQQGANWAVEKSRNGSVPIRRPIEVVVRKNQIALLPSRHATQGSGATGATVDLNQSMDQISQEFITALQTRVREWGLAGNGLHWRPVLELKVGPDAQQTAHNIALLLKDSGVEVRLPEVAQTAPGATSNATK